MSQTSSIIVGAGQFGLAMSRELSLRSIDHVLLERGSAPGHARRSERWDSLRLLTPNWANGLPGAPYAGSEPNGFMSASDMAEQLQRYAAENSPPLKTQTNVTRCFRDGCLYGVETDRGTFFAPSVVIATGAAARADVPTLSRKVPPGILQITPTTYRRPTDLPDGRILVVGAAASGVQIARELQRSGRQVTLSVGSHVRLPRHYRGKDIEHWLTVTGILDQTIHDIDDVERARRLPAPQLVADDAIDLNTLQEMGVEVVGRLQAIRDGDAIFSGSLPHVVEAADLKMGRTLDLIDAWLVENDAPVSPRAERPAPTRIPQRPRLFMSLKAEPITAVVWATGFRPDHSWLDLPAFDARGRLKHQGGVCDLPGLYVLGLPITRRRRSHHISGVGPDSHELAAHLAHFLSQRRAVEAPAPSEILHAQ